MANASSDNVSVIDGSTNQVIKTVAVGDFPQGVDVNPETNLIYVANADSDDVSVIDGSTNQVINTVTVGVGLFGLAVNQESNLIYVTNSSRDNVNVIDGSINKVIKTVSVGDDPSGVAVNPKSNLIYVANTNIGKDSGNVSVIDGSTNQVINTVTVGDFPSQVAANPETNLIYVSNWNSGDVSVIDGSTNQVINTVTVEVGVFGLAVNQETNLIYVASEVSGDVNVIDGSTNQVISTVTVGNDPIAVAVNAETNLIYVANRDSGDVSVIDGSINQVINTVTVGDEPSGITVNSETNLIYVANKDSGNVSVIDGSINQAIRTLVVGGPVEVAVNPRTNLIYVSNIISGDITVIRDDGGTVLTPTPIVTPKPTTPTPTPIRPEKPKADFSAEPTSGIAPLIVQFIDMSTGDIDTWQWDFGDGGTSLNQNPSHEYVSKGKFTVKLTVSGPGGSDTKRKFRFIDVEEQIATPTPTPTPPIAEMIPPTAKFTMTAQGKTANENETLELTVPDDFSQITVNFSAANSGDSDGFITSFEWKWQNTGIVISTDEEFSQDIGIGTGVIVLTVTDDDGLTDTATGTIDVTSEGIVFGSLLEKFAPILHLHNDDFRPMPIDAMLDESVLNTGNIFIGNIDSPTTVDLMNNNRNGTFLDLKDANPGTEELTSEVPDKTRWDPIFYPSTVYGREFKPNSQQTVLQYWFFYVFNNYTDFSLTINPLAPPTTIQRHEGDWEMIQVILDSNDEPVKATYSYHQGGIPHNWNDLEFDEILDSDKTHAKVFIARGGHGSWSTPGNHDWHQDIITCDTGNYIDVTTDNEDVFFPDSIAPIGASTYDLIDISEESESNNHWTHWRGRWGEVEGLLEPNKFASKKLGTSGPDSPANIQYGDAPKRWTKPIEWGDDPQPSKYEVCLAPTTVVFANNPHGQLVAKIEGSVQDPVSILSAEDLTFEIYPLEDGQVEFSISRYSRKDRKFTTVNYKDIYLSVRDKAVLPFGPWNPELQLSIERNHSGIINEWIRPHILDIR